MLKEEKKSVECLGQNIFFSDQLTSAFYFLVKQSLEDSCKSKAENVALVFLIYQAVLLESFYLVITFCSIVNDIS